MIKHFTTTFLLLLISTSSASLLAQDNNDFDQLSKKAKDSTLHFPLDYKILRPRLEFPNWDNDFDMYYNFLTAAIRKTQASFSYNDKGVITTVTPNSIIPHAQHDPFISKMLLFGAAWRWLLFC